MSRAVRRVEGFRGPRGPKITDSGFEIPPMGRATGRHFSETSFTKGFEAMQCCSAAF